MSLAAPSGARGLWGTSPMDSEACALQDEAMDDEATTAATEIPPPPPDPAPGPLPAPSLHRSRSHRVVAGVARGIADRFGVAPRVVRAGFIVLVFATGCRSPSLSSWLAADPRRGDRQVGPRALVADRHVPRPRGGTNRDRAGGPSRLDGDRPRRPGRRGGVGGMRGASLSVEPIAVGCRRGTDGGHLRHRWITNGDLSSGNRRYPLRLRRLRSRESRRRCWGA